MDVHSVGVDGEVVESITNKSFEMGCCDTITVMVDIYKKNE